jgi:hypothetical protein
MLSSSGLAALIQRSNDDEILKECSISPNQNYEKYPMFRTCCNNKPLIACRVAGSAIGCLVIFMVILVVLYAAYKERIK